MLKTVSTNKKLSTRADGLYIDPTFETNYAACKALGIPVGVYYYTYAQTKAQANAELAMLRKALKGKSFELPIAVDVEDNRLKPLSAADLTALVSYAAKSIEAWKYYAMVYTYTSYANTELDMDKLAAFDLWIADYRGTRPTRTHGLWQYTSTGSVPGIAGGVDLSHAYKDYPSIIQKAKLTGA
jgi:GH25 family lysozyme M1 (1,4-beta-N-acetylmuramidase)